MEGLKKVDRSFEFRCRDEPKFLDGDLLTKLAREDVKAPTDAKDRVLAPEARPIRATVKINPMFRSIANEVESCFLLVVRPHARTGE